MSITPVSKKRMGQSLQLRRVKVRLVDMSDSQDRATVISLFAQHHYLGSPAFTGRHLVYAIETEDGKHCWGLLSFSTACRMLGARDRFLGWNAIQRERRLSFFIQNNRFLLFPGVRSKNLASRALGLCMKQVGQDWEDRFGEPVLAAETFVDPSRFSGTSYKAANWQRVGESQGYSQEGSSYVYHGQPKTVWVYPLRPESWQHLRAKVLPENLQKFERSATDQTVLKTASEKRITSLQDGLQRIPDTRGKQGRTHRISTCVSIVVLGLAAGAESISGCLAFAQTLNKRQLQALGTYCHPRTRELRLPSYPTLCRILASIDPQEVEMAFNAWQQANSQCPLALAIDGKTLRGSLSEGETEGHTVVTAYAHDPATPFLSRPCTTPKHMSERQHVYCLHGSET